MPISYTPNYNLAMPPRAYREWTNDINTNWSIIDGILQSHTVSLDLKVNIADNPAQEAVLSQSVTDPSTLTPITGDRYIVPPGATGDWSGQDGDIAEWDGSQWVFTTPAAGTNTYIVDEDKHYYYDGVTWNLFGGGGGVTVHAALTGLGADDHLQYYNATRLNPLLAAKSDVGHSHPLQAILTNDDEATQQNMFLYEDAGKTIDGLAVNVTAGVVNGIPARSVRIGDIAQDYAMSVIGSLGAYRNSGSGVGAFTQDGAGGVLNLTGNNVGSVNNILTISNAGAGYDMESTTGNWYVQPWGSFVSDISDVAAPYGHAAFEGYFNDGVRGEVRARLCEIPTNQITLGLHVDMISKSSRGILVDHYAAGSGNYGIYVVEKNSNAPALKIDSFNITGNDAPLVQFSSNRAARDTLQLYASTDGATGYALRFVAPGGGGQLHAMKIESGGGSVRQILDATVDASIKDLIAINHSYGTAHATPGKSIFEIDSVWTVASGSSGATDYGWIFNVLIDIDTTSYSGTLERGLLRLVANTDSPKLIDLNVDGPDTVIFADAFNATHFIDFQESAGHRFKVYQSGQLHWRVYSQTSEPTLDADGANAWWIDTDDSNRVYLVFRRGSGDQVKVELT